MWMCTGMTTTANVLFAIQESNWPGKIIVLILMLGSIGAWTIMLTKAGELRRAVNDSARFLIAFRNETDPVALMVKRRAFGDSPLYRVYEAGCLTFGGELDAVNGGSSELPLDELSRMDRNLTTLQFETIRNAAERATADQALLMEDRMGFLATAVSASPFLGLLGTVWGVMDAFGGMAATGSATLSAVAPGISGALLTTVVGLLVAIPSAIGYNFLIHRIRKLTVQTDNFAQEFIAAVQRHYLGK